MVLNPRHRVKYADFFVAPEQTQRMEIDGPPEVVSEIQLVAARAGRTWNTQLSYVFEVCMGEHLPDFDDGRSVEDWRTLLSRFAFRLSETGDWIPCAVLWRKKP